MEIDYSVERLVVAQYREHLLFGVGQRVEDLVQRRIPVKHGHLGVFGKPL